MLAKPSPARYGAAPLAIASPNDELADGQVVSGIAEFYKPEELMDRLVVVFCNLKEGNVRKVRSQAMVLAAATAGLSAYSHHRHHGI